MISLICWKNHKKWVISTPFWFYWSVSMQFSKIRNFVQNILQKWKSVFHTFWWKGSKWLISEVPICFTFHIDHYNSFIWCHFDHSDTFIFIMILLKPNLEYFKKYKKICKIRHTQCISADCWTLKSYKKGSSHCVKYKIVFELSRYIFWVISRRLNSKLII